MPLRKLGESADKFVRRPVATTSATGLQGLETVNDKVINPLTKFFKNYLSEYKENIRHTYDHKTTFAIIEKKIFGKNSIDSVTHDLDKMILYILGFKHDFVSEVHRKISSHHPESGRKVNLRSMLVDNVASNPVFKPEKKLSLREYYQESRELQKINGLGQYFEKHNFGESINNEEVIKEKENINIKIAAAAGGLAQIVSLLFAGF